MTEDAAAARRKNYERLLEILPGRAVRPFDGVPEGAAPFVFPLVTTQKQALLDTLANHGIDAFDFWSIAYPSLDADRFPAIQERRRQTVGLPVHQELRPHDVTRIAAVVADAVETERE